MWDPAWSTGASSEREKSGGKVEDDEDAAEPHGELWRIVAEEHVEVEGGDGVEEGAAGDEQGLDDHWPVRGMCQRSCTGVDVGGRGAYTVRSFPICTIQTDPHVICTIAKRNMKQTTIGP